MGEPGTEDGLEETRSARGGATLGDTLLGAAKDRRAEVGHLGDGGIDAQVLGLGELAEVADVVDAVEMGQKDIGAMTLER